MRLILLGFLHQLPVGDVPVFSQMVKKQVSAFQPIEHYVLDQRVETTMVSSL